jgi:hypothetical protein
MEVPEVPFLSSFEKNQQSSQKYDKKQQKLYDLCFFLMQGRHSSTSLQRWVGTGFLCEIRQKILHRRQSGE